MRLGAGQRRIEDAHQPQGAANADDVAVVGIQCIEHAGPDGVALAGGELLDLRLAVDAVARLQVMAILHLELGADWKRFETAPALSAWLGLTPSLNQSGESSRQGAITKTGSMLARRLLVESAWHYSRQPRLGATLANRQAGQPDHILQISNRAQQRLHRVNRSMRARGKPHNVTVVACARQLACFLWAAATAD